MTMNWVFEKKLNHIQFDFEYKKVKYIIRGRTIYKNKVLNITFGFYGDDFPCIMLDYDVRKELFKVYKLRALGFGSVKGSEMATCLQPPLPEKGALDILVMFSLSVAEKLNPNAIVEIRDEATIDDNKSLSWLKYFSKAETTYSKYGFIRRFSTLNFDDSKSYEIFKNYMTNVHPKDLLYKINDVLYDKTLYKLEDKYKVLNVELKKKKIKMRKFSLNYTFEKVILDWLETEYLGYILEIIDKDNNIDIRGRWYLSWYYYNNNIKDKVVINKIQEL